MEDEQSGNKTVGRRCPGKPLEERHRFKWFLWQEMIYSWVSPVAALFQRVKSVTIKIKPGAALRGHVAPLEALFPLVAVTQAECLFHSAG